MTSTESERVLLTGATGFVGAKLYPHLVDAGYEVVCGSRRPDRARSEHPERDWVELDVERPDTLERALADCDVAYYLIHQMTSGSGYRERERRSALNFRDAAESAELDRLVYLGGVEPKGGSSEHLESRLETGRVLRSGEVLTVELRASMIIGRGSSSWQIVRDLAARLPAMLLPAWTQTQSQPIWIGDAIAALVAALEIEVDGPAYFNIPGPEILTVEEILVQTAKVLGNSPWTVDIPLLTPRLSSYWLRFVTRADTEVARELIEGLKYDLVATDRLLWEVVEGEELTSFDEAARRELEPADGTSARMIERAVRMMTPASQTD